MEGTSQIVTEAQVITDYLAGPLSNLERQQLFRDRLKALKKYKRCRQCNAWLSRKVGNDRDWSPTDDAGRAFCGKKCKTEFERTTPTHRVVRLQGVPQPTDISLLPTVPHDMLRNSLGELLPEGKQKRWGKSKKSTNKLRRHTTPKCRHIGRDGFTDTQLANFAQRLVDDLVKSRVTKKKDAINHRVSSTGM